MGSEKLMFYTAKGERIDTSAMRVVLPSGEAFEIEADIHRDDAAMVRLDPGTPEAPSRRVFTIEPGAVNLFFIGVRTFADKK